MRPIQNTNDTKTVITNPVKDSTLIVADTIQSVKPK